MKTAIDGLEQPRAQFEQVGDQRAFRQLLRISRFGAHPSLPERGSTTAAGGGERGVVRESAGSSRSGS